VIKHAAAKNVIIQFQKSDEGLSIVVKDDGRGFNLSEIENKKTTTTGFGLFAVKERIQNMDGQFYLKSIPGNGTEARIHLA
jgi:signal transduction histidine kinase